MFVVVVWLTPSALAQKVWSVGVLSSYPRPPSFAEHPLYGPFLRQLRELGYVEGKNLRIEWAFSDGNDSRLADLAKGLVDRRVDAIVTVATPGIRAAQAATSTIPIVFLGGSDVVAQGFVKSLAHPGGNITGFTTLIPESTEKQVEILRTLVPGLSRVGYLFNPENPASALLVSICRKAAEKLGSQVVPLEVRSKEGIESAIAGAQAQRVGGLVCGMDLFLLEQGERIARAAARHRLPSVAMYPEFAQAGGLAAYGPDRAENWRRVAVYLDRIFKGESPGYLPVQQPTTLHLVINRNAANALGLTIPPELLLEADKVIE